MSRFISQRAAAFWDANKDRVKDPACWLAIPMVRQAVNRRISGSIHEWPLDWFKRVHAPAPFERGVSFGCGTGPFERSARRIELVREIDAFDVSPVSLDEARREADQEQLTGIHYRIGSFDDLPAPVPHRYDIAFFHASLHHVSNLEGLFRWLSVALKPRGAIYLDEYVGPSRDRWTAHDIALAQAVLDLLPDDRKIKTRMEFPIDPDDPSEAVRSGEIVRFVPEYFDIIEWRPFGGQLLDLVVPYLHQEWVRSTAGQKAVGALLDIEEDELRRDSSTTHQLVAFGRLKEKREMTLI